jgi:hypothetical protein
METNIPSPTNHITARKWAFSSCRITGAKVAPFSSGDAFEWNRWKLSFHEVVSMNGWDDARARGELHDCMRGRAANFTHFIETGVSPAPGFPVFPYNDLVRRYDQAFEAKDKAITRATDTLENVSQMEGERIVEFHARMKMRYQCSFPNLTEAQLDQSIDLARLFCAGLQDHKIGRVLFGGRSRTYLGFSVQAMILTDLATQYEEEAKWDRRDRKDIDDCKTKELYREDDGRPAAKRFKQETKTFRNHIEGLFLRNCMEQGLAKKDLATMRGEARGVDEAPRQEFNNYASGGSREQDSVVSYLANARLDARVVSSTQGNALDDVFPTFRADSSESESDVDIEEQEPDTEPGQHETGLDLAT